jgi:cell division septation protein DedD
LANFERGVYEPRDEARDGTRVFDGSEEEDDIEGSRLPLLIVLALLVLAMFGGVVWLAYTQGVARGRGETPVLTAAGGPERVAPPQAGGSNVPYQGFKIYEQPAPSDDSADAAPAAASPSSTPVAPKPVPAQVAAPAPPKAAVAPPAKAAPSPPAKAAPAPPKSVAALIQQANSVPEVPKPVPAAKSAAMKPAAAPASGPATGAPRQLAAVAPASPPSATGSAYVLQIGAYKSQADAEGAWKTYKARHAALLSGYSDSIQQVQLGEKGTWYRLRIGGLSDREVATALCDRLKADGGACILGR